MEWMIITGLGYLNRSNVETKTRTDTLIFLNFNALISLISSRNNISLPVLVYSSPYRLVGTSCTFPMSYLGTL